MLKISTAVYDGFAHKSSEDFRWKLAEDLWLSFPERFFRMSEADMRGYVDQRIDYFARFDVLDKACIAEVMKAECMALADFMGQHEGSWWAEILEEDTPQHYKARRLMVEVDHLEPGEDAL